MMRNLGQRLCLAVCLMLALLPTVQAQQPELKQREPFFLLPTIEGLLVCDQGANDSALGNLNAIESDCARRGQHGAARVSALLDQLEPGGPKGQVQLGYVATLQLLSLYQKANNGAWQLDTRRLDAFFKLIVAVQRPVLIYLAADHFDSQGPLVDELLRDPVNLMQLPNGQAPVASYFGYRIVPYTLQTDASIPVNRYRYEALRQVVGRINRLPHAVKARVVGVSLLGELHHLFPNFESGMAEFDRPLTTDYSPASILAFREWLRQRHSSLGALNAAMGRDKGKGFKRWADIAPPSPLADPPKDDNLSLYRNFANGWLPVSGWMWWPNSPKLRVTVWVNGVQVGQAETGLNRLDVYRALDAVTHPNVGFRYELDISKLPPGKHSLQVLLEGSGKPVVLGQVSLVVEGTPKSTNTVALAPVARPAELPAMRSMAQAPGLQAWLDRPAATTHVRYNPLAREWDAFRAWQVRHFLDHFVRQALDAGLPARWAYSHQIVPRVNSSWNHHLFAVEDSLTSPAPWQHGVNMYGGATDSGWLTGYLRQRHIAGYGVPEFNPQQWKTPGVHLAALQRHFDAGAKFVSPYYLSVVPERLRAQQHGVNAMEIRPDNPSDGSSAFWHAIRQFSAY